MPLAPARDMAAVGDGLGAEAGRSGAGTGAGSGDGAGATTGSGSEGVGGASMGTGLGDEMAGWDEPAARLLPPVGIGAAGGSDGWGEEGDEDLGWGYGDGSEEGYLEDEYYDEPPRTGRQYVFEDEPNVPAALLGFDNVVVQPHHASGTVETRTAMGELMIENLVRHFAGDAVLTPVG